MENQKTELVFILDRSGSMGGLESDTVGGFNAFIEKQKKLHGEVTVTTVLFDNQIEFLHDRMDMRAMSPISEEDYSVRGSTALYDAIGTSIHKIINVQKMSKAEYKASKVIFVITTDGMENASQHYSAYDIKSLISYQEKKYNWEFIFLGANIDAITTAQTFGIRKSRAAQFHNDKEGINVNYKNLDELVCMLRSDKAVDETWKKDIEDDFKSR